MVNLNYGLGLPRNITEMVWSMFTMALQIYMNALILGTLLNFLVQKDPVQEAYKKKIDDLHVFMEAKHIPSELRERIYKHFQFQHQKNVQNKAAASVTLPRSLQIKVADAKYKVGPGSTAQQRTGTEIGCDDVQRVSGTITVYTAIPTEYGRDNGTARPVLRSGVLGVVQYIIDKCTDKGRTLHGCNLQFISALLTRLQVPDQTRIHAGLLQKVLRLCTNRFDSAESLVVAAVSSATERPVLTERTVLPLSGTGDCTVSGTQY